MNFMLAAEITRGEILTTYYLIPFLTLLLSLGLNYVLGTLAVNRLVKRYMPGKAEKLCFLPLVRYYYVGKLAFSGKFSKQGLSWVGIAVPIVRGIEIVVDMIINVVTTVFAYACNVDIVALFKADEIGFEWQADLEGMILPQWIAALDTLSFIAFACYVVLAAILFINFYRRFKTRQGVLFGILSLVFIDGIFLFACRNNGTVEEEVERIRSAMNGQPPYGNPYGAPNQNPYGQNFYQGNPYNQNPSNSNPYGQNPYQGNPNPYGQGGQNPYNPNPYGNPNPYQSNQSPYGNANNPYGQNGTSFGAPQHPNASQPSGETNPFSDLEGDNSPSNAQGGGDSPFSEFDNKD